MSAQPKKLYDPHYDTDYGSDDIAEICHALLQRDGLEQYAVIGFFLQWFAALELGLDGLLAWVAENREPDVFEILITGLPPRSKVERLRSLCKVRGIEFGPNFKARLTHFEEKVIPVRNNLAHRMLMHRANEDHITFVTRRTIMDVKDDAKRKKLPSIPTLLLFEHGGFLNQFSSDLQSLIPESGIRPTTFEIAAPRSGLPKAQSPNSPPAIPPASAGTRARRRAAKKHNREE